MRNMSSQTSSSHPQRRPLPATAESGSTGFLLFIFMICIILPIRPEIAGITLQPYKIFLLIGLIPFVLTLKEAKSGGFNIIDGLILCLSIWSAITLVYTHGTARVPLAIITAVETMGAYLAGRVLVRSFAQLRYFLIFYVLSMLILLPFAYLENQSGDNILTRTFGAFLPVNSTAVEIRGGGYRAQSTFAHAIHYGIFSACLFACLFYSFRMGLGKLLALAISGASVFFSQSSAPLLSLGVQIGMIFWGIVTRGSWKLLFGLIAALYIALEILSNRGLIIIIIETLTLNPRTAWWRVHTWNYGTEAVWDHPIFGHGLFDWNHPDWLTSSVDNFWLATAIRHGLPAVIFILAALTIQAIRILRAQGLTPEQSKMRVGYMVSFSGLIFSLTTVYMWGQLNIFVMFFWGAGAVFFTANTGEDTPPDSGEGDAPEAPTSPYTRFPSKSVGDN